MFCGTRSFSYVDEDPQAPSKLKASIKKRSLYLNQRKSKQSRSKNPYSSKGLDKFSKVLAELEAKREEIMSRTRSQGATTMVRFTYSNSEDWVPIIIRPREPKQRDGTKPAADVKKLPPPMQKEPEVVEESKEVVKKPKEDRKRKKSTCWNSYYWPLVMVLMLVCVVMFGRVFAICCTTVWWYMVPIMEGGGSGNLRRKEYGKWLSDKRLGGNLGLAPPSSSQGGLQELASPRALVNGKRG